MTSTEPVVKEIPEIRVISKRGKGEPSAVIPALIGEVMQQIFSPSNQRGNVNIVGPITLLFNGETLTGMPEKGEVAKIEWEIAVPIVGRISVEPGFEVKSLPAGKMVTVVYTGPYQEVGGAYARAIEYVGSQGLQVYGLCREMYLNNPQEVPEDRLMTEIQIPVL